MSTMLPPGFTLAVVPHFEHEGRYRWILAKGLVVQERSRVSYPDDATALTAGIRRAHELAVKTA